MPVTMFGATIDTGTTKVSANIDIGATKGH